MTKIFKEFREFALRGNVLDLAIGVIIGGAFSTVVKSFTGDILTPPLELLKPREFGDLYILLREGTPPGPYPSLDLAREAGAVTINYGSLLDAIIAFVLTAIALFILIRAINRFKRQEEAGKKPAPAPTIKNCPYCLSEIPIKASRCAFCTSQLPPGESGPMPDRTAG
jgi:large conductance mechanosensitive channel